MSAGEEKIVARNRIGDYCENDRCKDGGNEDKVVKTMTTETIK